MQRWIVTLAFLFITIAVVVLLFNSRDAYELLPVKPSQSLNEEEDEGWKEYKSEADGFKVNFPLPPQEATENIRNPDTNELRLYRMFVSQTPDGKAFMVSVVTFSQSAYSMGNQALMNRFVGELIAGKNESKLEKMEQTSFQGKEALSFRIDNPQVDMDGLVFMDGPKLIFLSEVAPKGTQLSDFERFINTYERTQ